MLEYLTDEVVNHLLTNQWFVRIACAMGDEVALVPVTYFFNGQHIYGHTREGTKTRLMRQNPNVCFEVDKMVSTTLWRSVVVHGTFEELTGDDRLWALQRLGPRQAPFFADERPAKDGPQSGETRHLTAPETVVYRIRIQSKTGRSIQR